MSWMRRGILAAMGASGTAACVPLEMAPGGRLQSRLRIIEAASGGTLGAAILDTGSGEMVTHRPLERFGHCSSFKLSLAALTLWREQQGIDEASRLVRWSENDLMFVSPFTTRRLAEGASLRELAEFTQKYSDNTAANVLLREFGGPPALTEFWRALGDAESRLDRTEPELNLVPPGELRDTTIPAAMARTVAELCFGDTLDAANRAILRQWMVDTRTGARRVRAGLPDSWNAGDKTGTSIWPGMDGLYVDIGFVEPSAPSGQSRAPLTFAIYFRAPAAHEDMDPASEAVLAQVGEVLADFARR